MKLSYPVAVLLAKIAEREATKLQVPMAISIADDQGNMIYFGCMDNTLPAGREIAISKAYTAAILRMDTRMVGELSNPGKPLYGIQNTHQGRLILFGGGFPLFDGTQVVGGIGISGGSVEEDEKVARPVQATFETMMTCAAMITKIIPRDKSLKVSSDCIEKIIRRKLDKGPSDEHVVLMITGALLLALA